MYFIYDVAKIQELIIVGSAKMFNQILFGSIMIILFLSNTALTPLFGQVKNAAAESNALRGDYGPYRANND